MLLHCIGINCLLSCALRFIGTNLMIKYIFFAQNKIYNGVSLTTSKNTFPLMICYPPVKINNVSNAELLTYA